MCPEGSPGFTSVERNPEVASVERKMEYGGACTGSVRWGGCVLEDEEEAADV